MFHHQFQGRGAEPWSREQVAFRGIRCVELPAPRRDTAVLRTFFTVWSIHCGGSLIVLLKYKGFMKGWSWCWMQPGGYWRLWRRWLYSLQWYSNSGPQATSGPWHNFDRPTNQSVNPKINPKWTDSFEIFWDFSLSCKFNNHSMFNLAKNSVSC